MAQLNSKFLSANKMFSQTIATGCNFDYFFLFPCLVIQILLHVHSQNSNFEISSRSWLEHFLCRLLLSYARLISTVPFECQILSYWLAVLFFLGPSKEGKFCGISRCLIREKLQHRPFTDRIKSWFPGRLQILLLQPEIWAAKWGYFLKLPILYCFPVSCVSVQ